MEREEATHAKGDIVAEKFRVIRRLGQGGMGEVYEAEHLMTHKRVALKIMLGLKNVDGDAAKERFLREARAACAIRHAAIVPVHDIIDVDNRLIIVMDLLEGQDLFALLARNRVHYLQAVEYILPIVSALGALHAKGFIHRDIKPENIFITEQGPFLLDLGIVKDTKIQSRLTSNDPIGTPMYMSPEQAFGVPMDHRADLWSLGLVLYEALTAHAPTEAEAVGKVFELIRCAPIPPLNEFAPEAPQELDDLLHQMLERDPQKRPDGMHVVYDGLAKYANTLLLQRYPRPHGPGEDASQISKPSLRLTDDVSAVSATSKAGASMSRPIIERRATGGDSPAPMITPMSGTKKPQSKAGVAVLALVGVAAAGALGYGGMRYMEAKNAAPPPTATPADATASAPAQEPSVAPQDSVTPPATASAIAPSASAEASAPSPSAAPSVGSSSAPRVGRLPPAATPRTTTAPTAPPTAKPTATTPPAPPTSSTRPKLIFP